jgi:hypothetical protein
MLFTRHLNKLRLPAFILLLAAFLCAACLSLAEDAIQFTIAVDPASLTAPGEVTVSVNIANAGTSVMSEPVKLYDPAHNLVTAFKDGGSSFVSQPGSVAAGTIPWTVTQAQLDAGKITFTIEYNVIGADNSVTGVIKEASAVISFTGERIKLDVKRTIDPPIARKGGTVTVFYELANNGNVALTDIKVRENSSIAKNSQTIASLAPGIKETVKFTAVMGSAALKSSCTVTYKAAGKTDALTEKVEEVSIPLAAPNLQATLAASSTSINIGETVVMKLTMVNKGNVSYSNITVTDEKQGVVFTNLELPAGETLEKEKEFTLMAPANFLYNIALQDNTGASNTLKTNAVLVSAYDPAKQLRLSLVLTSDRASIDSLPSDIHFNLVVTNNSDIAASNIVIRHGATDIYTIAALAPDQSMTVARDYSISQAGKFRFTASTKDSLNNTVSFESNELQIAYVAPTQVPTLVPSITIAPLVTVTSRTIEQIDRGLPIASNVVFIVLLVFAALLAVCFILFLISSIARMNARRKSNNAYDHLDLAERRDYTEPAASADEAKDAVSQGKIADEDLPHAKYLQEEDAVDVPGKDAAVQKTEEPPAPAAAPEVTDEGSYRMTRTDGDVPETARTRRTARRQQHKPSEDE